MYNYRLEGVCMVQCGTNKDSMPKCAPDNAPGISFISDESLTSPVQSEKVMQSTI